MKRKDQDDTSGKYIEDIIIERLKGGRDTLISGQADSGKTRMAYEVLRSLGKDYVFFIPFIDKSVNIDDISLYLCLCICSIRKKKYVFFFDDIQKYKTPLGIPDTINKIAKKGFDTVILATIREGVQEDDLKNSPLLNEKRFSYLRDRENNIVVPSLTSDEAEDIAEETGNEIPTGFDGNLTAGMIVSGWKKIRDQYRIVADRSPPAKRLVDINKTIYDLGLSRTDYDRVNCIISVIDDEKLSKKEYNEAENVLRKSSVIGWNEKGYWLSGGKLLENIVSGDVSQVPDLDEIIKCFSENKDYNALFEISFSLHMKGEDEEALKAISEVVSIKPDLYEAWYNWGSGLSDLARQVYPDDHNRGGELFGEAFEKYRKAVEFRKNYHEAWYNWGTALSHLAEQVYPEDPGRGGELFGEAFEKYRKAIESKPDKSEAWYNWGTYLSGLALQVYPKDRDRGRELFKEAFEKYDRAVEIKPDFYEAWYNWGTVLSDLAKQVYPEDPGRGGELFKEAFEKYEKVVEIKPDDHDAWNNWGTALSYLAEQVYPKDPGRGGELFREVFKKYEKAVEIKPDYHNAWNNWRLTLAIFEKYIDPDDEISKIILEREKKRYEEKRSQLPGL